MSESYNLNSVGQKATILASTPYIHQAIDVFTSSSPLIIISDYGSSHGLNSFFAMKTIIDYLRETRKITENQQVLVVHNDLPTNDWKLLFKVLQEKKEYYGVASGKSFYEQCLPDNSLSIGYSSTSLQWLSQKPCNLSNHCMSANLDENDPERLAFAQQAQLDYTRFLEHRARELVQGGVLILTIPSLHPAQTGSLPAANKPVYRLLYQCAQALLTPEELLNYTIPCHHRSFDDFLDHSLFVRCSLQLIKAEQITVKNPTSERMQQGTITVDEYARARTLSVYSWSASTLEQALAQNPQKEMIINQFWAMFEEQVKQHPEQYFNEMRPTSLILQKF